MRLIVFLLMIFAVNITCASNLLNPENFEKNVTIVSLNPTWSCPQCVDNNSILQDLTDVLSKQFSVEYKSLFLPDDDLQNIFFIAAVPTTLIYDGKQLIEVVTGIHFQGEEYYLDMLRRHNLPSLSNSEFYQQKNKLQEINKKETPIKAKDNQELNQNTSKVVKTCIRYDTRRVQVGGLLQWQKARGECLIYDERTIKDNEELLVTCTEYEYKRVQSGGPLQTKQVKAFCKSYDVDTVLKSLD